MDRGFEEANSSNLPDVDHEMVDLFYRENADFLIAGVQEDQPELPTLKLRLKKPKRDRKVMWTTETVDNEHMNKKKSKCCCIYEKPRKFGESSSDEDDSDEECDHCKGHVEKKKDKHKAEEEPSTSSTPDDQAVMSES